MGPAGRQVEPRESAESAKDSRKPQQVGEQVPEQEHDCLGSGALSIKDRTGQEWRTLGEALILMGCGREAWPRV